MLLSDRDIQAELRHGGLRIHPLDDAQIQPASVDLRLGSGLRAYQARDEPVSPQSVPPGLAQRISFTTPPGYVLRPDMFVLGCTAETVELPAHLAAQIDGRSTLGRLGIVVHLTAGWVDPGFCGQLTLEIASVGPLAIRLTEGMPIAQLCIFRCSSPALRPYGSPGLRSRYQGQAGPVPAPPAGTFLTSACRYGQLQRVRATLLSVKLKDRDANWPSRGFLGPQWRGITGFRYGCALSMLAHAREHGEGLRCRRNLAGQFHDEGERASESGGALHPAVLTAPGPEADW